MLKWGHGAIRMYKYKIPNEQTSEQDSIHCSSFVTDVWPFGIHKLYLVISAISSLDPLFFSSTSNTESAACLLQRAGYMAIASATL